MKIIYRKGDKLFTCEASNDDIEISFIKECGRNTAVITAKTPLRLISAEETFPFTCTRSDRIFLNGYQSWTDTKEYTLSDKQNDLRNCPDRLIKKYSFKSAGDQTFYDFPKNTLHGFDIAYVKGEKELFIGSRNYKNAYLIIEISKKSGSILLRSDVEGKNLAENEAFTVFDYMTADNADSGTKKYFEEITPVTDRKLFGYTSWYNHYQNINSQIIEKALEESDPRFELFQIDDGFEPYVGDWLETDSGKFPDGLSPIVEKIHGKGMLAGIWLAPFAAEKNSSLVKNHPEWIKRDDNGNPVSAGPNWSGFYPLDLNNPCAVGYIRTVLKHYADMGFDFFKLDFLYAANLSPISGKTRAETSEMMYDILREELDGKLILGCGAVITNAFGKFDYMRVGPDVSLKFDDVFYMKYFHRERISTKVTLQNTIFRSIMNGHAFMNDPDVFLLRDDNISLSEKQRTALTTINAVFGSLMTTSDNPKNYDSVKKAILDNALDIFRNAENKSYRVSGSEICFSYTLDGKTFSFRYNTRKGILENG